MMKADSFTPTVERLSALVKKHYGCDLKYQDLKDLSRDLMDEQLNRNLKRGEPITAGDLVFFPIFRGADLAGAARLTRRDRIDENDIQYLHQMIRMVIESKLSQLNRIDVLEQLENHLLYLSKTTTTTLPKNVVRVHQFQGNPFPLPAFELEQEMNFPFLIECKIPEDIFKMALEIHSRAHRYAFLNLEDIAPSALTDPKSIDSLGGITIFISEVTELTLSQQEALLEYFKSPRTKDGPQIISGSTMSLSELKKSGKVLAPLLQHLTIGYLVMTAPFAVYKKENVLAFFYESLLGRADDQIPTA